MDEEVAVHVDRLGVTPEAVEEMYVDVVTPLTLIHWRAIAAGCVAIWPGDCPQAAQSQGSVNAGPSRGTFSKSGQQGPKNRGRGRRVRFGGLNVLYDEEGIA